MRTNVIIFPVMPRSRDVVLLRPHRSIVIVELIRRHLPPVTLADFPNVSQAENFAKLFAQDRGGSTVVREVP